VPKRGDFFHVKVFRRVADGVLEQQAARSSTATLTSNKYNEHYFDRSTTFKFAPGAPGQTLRGPLF